MLEPNEGDGAAFASVETRRAAHAVERLKARLPAHTGTCPACGYEGAVFRWGIKAHSTRDPGRVELVLCCPSCERPTDLSSVGVDTGYRV